MALIDKASLLMVPSTYEAGTLYNVLPSGNRAPDSTDQNSGYDQTRADFDFDRGSNAAATRVNADGLIEKYRENLLLQSNQFDTTWVNSNSTETSGQADKDGGTDAWKIDITGVAGRIYQSKSQSGVVTFSVYAKKGTLDWVILSSNVTDASFNLATGEKGTLVSGIDSKIEAVGETGWYRCSFTGNGSFTQFRIYPAIADNTFTASSGNIYIQDAQAETSLVATDYLDSGATTAKAGVLIDLPRINYDANGENGALLLEPSRANLVAFSEYLNGGIWIKSGCFVTDNDSTSPEGLINAAKVEGGGGSTQIRLFDNLTFPSAGDYTLSVFAKAGNNNFLRLNIGGVDGAQNAYFDLANGTTEESWASIEPVGSDGWYRCSITADLTGPDLTGNYNFYVAYSYTTTLFPSNGDANGQYVYLYGAMVEQNATYPSSYIPTMGTSETRAADSCSVTGVSDVIGQTEGTLYAEFEIDADNTNGYNRVLAVGDGTSNNRIIMFAHYTERFRFYVASGGVAQIDMVTSTAVLGGKHKIAFAYKTNDFVAYVDGVQVGTDTSGTIPACPNVYLGTNEEGAAQNLEGDVQQAILFNERLSNAELAALTA